jgi:hypothetical protein
VQIARALPLHRALCKRTCLFESPALALKGLISSSSLSASAAFTSLSTINPQPSTLNPQPLWPFVFRRPGSTPGRPSARAAKRPAPPRPQLGDASPLPMTFVFYCEGIGWLPFAAPPGSTF